MARSSTETLEPVLEAPLDRDSLSLKRWLVVYGAYLVAMIVPTAVMLARSGVGWGQFFGEPAKVTASADPVLKMLIFTIYISICCTFLPLPTNPMAAAVGMQQFAPSQNVWITAALVATAGAWASMMANLLDFHLFTWILRRKRIARIRSSRLYQRAGRWFAREPFWILVIFNILPIPIDVIRMLAATYRYPLRPFAAANFMGRWIRYGVLAFVAFKLGELGWVAVVALLAAAIVLAGIRLVRRFLPAGKSPGDGPAEPVS